MDITLALVPARLGVPAMLVERNRETTPPQDR